MLTSTIKYNKTTDTEQTGTYNTEFLAALSAFGNRIMCRFEVDNTSYQSDDIRFVKRYSVVSLLKSVMYAAEIQIDGIHDLKDKVITDLQFGVSEDGVDYYLVSFGSFTITDSPSDLAGGFTTLTAYDGMLAAMQSYAPITYATEETNYTYFGKVASAIGLTVGSSIPNTGLMALSRISDVYTENNTYRDILDDYAEILGGCILVKDGKLELVTPTDVELSGENVSVRNGILQLTSDNPGDISIQDNVLTIPSTWGDLNGGILSLSVSGGSTLTASNLTNFAPKDPFPLIDNLICTFESSIVYKYDDTEAGTIINIADNGLIDIEDISTYMSAMYADIRAWGAFIPVEADSHGYMLFEPCDVISFSVNGSTYRIVWMSNDITISQGIAETISSDEPADRADDYFKSNLEHNFAVMVNTKADSIKTELIQTQQSITSKVSYEEYDANNQLIDNQFTQVEQTVSYINSTVNDMHASLNDNGLQIFKESVGDTVTTITGDGMKVNVLDGVSGGIPTLGDELLSATSGGVNATRLTADEYFKLDTANVSLQMSTFYNSIHSKYQVGLFVLKNS